MTAAPPLRANIQLALLIEEAGLSRLALAREVRDALTRQGLPNRCTHNNVRRWCEGHASRSVPPRVIAEVLAARLGRIVTPADIGMADPEAQRAVPLGYGSFLETPASVASAARALWSSDLDDAASARQSIPAGALSTPVLRWLVAPPPPAPTGSRSTRARAVAPADAHHLGAQAALFEELARRQGGGAARQSAVQYLRSHLAPLLSGRFGPETGTLLYAAAARSVLAVAGHTADTPRHGLTRRYHVLALSLAHQSGDRRLGARVLTSLAEHLLATGEARAAADVLGAAGLAGHPAPAALRARAACASGAPATAAALMADADGEAPDRIALLHTARCLLDLALPDPPAPALAAAATVLTRLHDPRAEARSADTRGTGAQEAGPQEAGAREAGPREAAPQEAGPQEASSQNPGAQEAGPQNPGAREAGPQNPGAQEAGPQNPGAQEAGPQNAGVQNAEEESVGTPGTGTGSVAAAALRGTVITATATTITAAPASAPTAVGTAPSAGAGAGVGSGGGTAAGGQAGTGATVVPVITPAATPVVTPGAAAVAAITAALRQIRPWELRDTTLARCLLARAHAADGRTESAMAAAEQAVADACGLLSWQAAEELTATAAALRRLGLTEVPAKLDTAAIACRPQD